MHDTAFQIGTLAMNIYADLRTDSILEIGSRGVNGSLRENALPTTRYVGVDIEAGDGVDIVLEPGQPFPVEDGSFDLVLASSVFEHDPCFWITFLEMCRGAKDGGYIYINAPSNGVVHRYPQDNWRFYPDSGKALAHWATSQGHAVTLVESFIAGRDQDIWNDFVAVFRKGPIAKALPKVFIHEHVSCTDVITWKSKAIGNPSEHPQDIILLREADERARRAEEELGRAASERDSLFEQTAELRNRLFAAESSGQRQESEIQELKNALNLRDSEVRQRQEEIQQTASELTKARLDLAAVRAEVESFEKRLQEKVSAALSAREMELKQARDEVERASSELEEARGDLVSLKAELASIEDQLAAEISSSEARQRAAESELVRAKAERDALQDRLSERFNEIAALSRMLVQARDQLEWLRETASIFVNGSTTIKGRLLSLLPASVQHRRHERLLKSKDLFDARAYLEAHADVASAGADPLRHYIVHGLIENRRRS